MSSKSSQDRSLSVNSFYHYSMPKENWVCGRLVKLFWSLFKIEVASSWTLNQINLISDFLQIISYYLEEISVLMLVLDVLKISKEGKVMPMMLLYQGKSFFWWNDISLL